MNKTVICPGSFDPVTRGHLDIINRAARMFDCVIVGVLVNSAKKPSFSIEERMDFLREATKELENVRVVSFEGLLAEYCRQNNVDAVVRGLRAVSDFEYEFQMALLNKALNPEYETVFLMTDSKYSYISSSMVKELAGFNGDLTGLVPGEIIEKIKQKYK